VSDLRPEETWFGPESKALRYYSKGWVWRPSRDGHNLWELWAPEVSGIRHKTAACTANPNGTWTATDPMCPSGFAHDRTGPDLHTAMGAAVDYMVEAGWAKLWDPLAPLRPLSTVRPGQDGMIDVTIGILRLELTDVEAEDLAEGLTEVLKEIGR
jgi:hypothetical protein